MHFLPRFLKYFFFCSRARSFNSYCSPRYDVTRLAEDEGANGGGSSGMYYYFYRTPPRAVGNGGRN